MDGTEGSGVAHSEENGSREERRVKKPVKENSIALKRGVFGPTSASFGALHVSNEGLDKWRREGRKEMTEVTEKGDRKPSFGERDACS